MAALWRRLGGWVVQVMLADCFRGILLEAYQCPGVDGWSAVQGALRLFVCRQSAWKGVGLQAGSRISGNSRGGVL